MDSWIYFLSFHLVIYNPQVFNTAVRKFEFDVNTDISFTSAGNNTKDIYTPLFQNQYFPYLAGFTIKNVTDFEFDISVHQTSLSLYIQTAISAGSAFALRFLRIITRSCAVSSPYLYNNLCYSSCPARTRLITSSSPC